MLTPTTSVNHQPQSMKKLARIASAIALAAASASSFAWWGGPFNTIADDLFGDGWGNLDMNINMNAGARAGSQASSRHRHHYGPYAYGPYGYAPYPSAVAPSPASETK